MKLLTRFFLTSIIAVCVSAQAYSQSKDIPAEFYNASTIPDSLKKDANSVLRYAMDNTIVKGPGKMINQIHTIVTILNEKADGKAETVIHYNKKYSSINSFEMIVYDAAGKPIKKYHKSDMYERSAVSSESIITDDRLMAIGYTPATYPLTIEINYEFEDNNAINWGGWSPQGEKQAIQNSYCKLSAASDIGFRYHNLNTSIIPKKQTVNNIDNYTWEVKNLKAIKLEDGAEAWRVLPQIYFGSGAFEFYGTKGDISSWKNFGQWVQSLNKDVCTLSPQRAEEIRKMTADIKTDKEKAKFLYDYMQKNVRYVSVQLGIGGFKPFNADFVDQKKYGDCKALSNYMYALLKAVNIPACYALIKAGANEKPADASFPYDDFNHAILCIPFKGDTTWLECTSNTQPFGKLGSFTENRNALLITEDGGKLVNTPKSTPDDNQFISQAHLTLQPDGSARATLKIATTGEYRGLYIDLMQQKLDDQKEYVIRHLSLKQPLSLEIKPQEDINGSKMVDVDLDYDRFCDIIAGDKLFYRPRLFDLWQVTMPTLDHRKSDYYFEHPMKKTCVTTIDLPPGYEVEALPANASLKFTYGNYEVTYVYDAAKNQITNTTKFNLNNFAIPAAKYTEMKDYMDAIAKVQSKKLVIRKKA